jgi:hypothetical protein
MYVLYLTLLHSPPPLRFHCVGGCWDLTQDSCKVRLDCLLLKCEDHLLADRVLRSVLFRGSQASVVNRFLKMPLEFGINNIEKLHWFTKIENSLTVNELYMNFHYFRTPLR